MCVSHVLGFPPSPDVLPGFLQCLSLRIQVSPKNLKWLLKVLNIKLKKHFFKMCGFSYLLHFWGSSVTVFCPVSLQLAANMNVYFLRPSIMQTRQEHNCEAVEWAIVFIEEWKMFQYNLNVCSLMSSLVRPSITTSLNCQCLLPKPLKLHSKFFPFMAPPCSFCYFRLYFFIWKGSGAM